MLSVFTAPVELRRVHGRGPIFVTFPEGDAELEELEDPPAGLVYVTRVSADQLKALLVGTGCVEVEMETRPDPLERPGVAWLYGCGRLTRDPPTSG